MNTGSNYRAPSIYIITAILACCSLLYELLIAHTIALLAANTVIWYSITIGIYLAAMGAGALVCNRLRNASNSWSQLFWVEFGLCLCGALAVPAIRIGHMLHSYYYLQDQNTVSLIFFFGVAFITSILIGLLSGLELPLLIRLGNELCSGKGKITNRVLGVDYIGSLIAGVLFPLLLVPHLELITIGIITASVNLAVIVFLLLAMQASSKPWIFKGLAITFVASALFVAIQNLNSIQQYFLKKYYYYMEASENLATLFGPMDKYPDIFHESSPYQKIDLVKSPGTDPMAILIDAYSSKFIKNPEFPRNRYLFLNGDFQLISNYEEIYHEYFAHVPIMISGKVPENVLMLGGGDGLLMRELAKHPSIKTITHVDLDQNLLDLAANHPILVKMNKNSSSDSRIETIIADGFYYMRHNEKKYDAIYIDFPYAVDYNLSKLYSWEFFNFVMRSLSKTGFAVFDATGTGSFSAPDISGAQYMTEDNSWPIYYNTLRRAGFKKIIPYVTNLELNNSRAFKVLDQLGIDFDQDLNLEQFSQAERNAFKKMLERNLLAEHIVSLQQGFIFMSNEIKSTEVPYSDFGVTLHVLNEDRFINAFALKFPSSKDIDQSYVNSIMRPTLPDLPLWHTRLPF